MTRHCEARCGRYPKGVTASSFRFHYGRRGRGGNYSQAELETWKRRIAAWRSRAEVFAYFNNDWQGYAPRNAAWLDSRLSATATARSESQSRDSRRR